MSYKSQPKYWYQAASGLAGSVINSITHGVLTSKANKFEQEKFEYQKEMDKLQMEREDTAYQRSVADQMKAGINPYVNSGEPSSAGDVGTTVGSLSDNAPSIDMKSLYDLSSLANEQENQKLQNSLLRAKIDEVESGISYNKSNNMNPRDTSTKRVQDVVGHKLLGTTEQIINKGSEHIKKTVESYNKEQARRELEQRKQNAQNMNKQSSQSKNTMSLDSSMPWEAYQGHMN